MSHLPEGPCAVPDDDEAGCVGVFQGSLREQLGDSRVLSSPALRANHCARIAVQESATIYNFIQPSITG